jgi:hypothetical protein
MSRGLCGEDFGPVEDSTGWPGCSWLHEVRQEVACVQTCNDGFENVGVDLFDGGFVADGEDATGFSGGDLFVLLVDAAVKIVGLFFEAIFVRALLLGVAMIAPAGATERDFERGEQKEGQIGLQVVAGGGVHGQDAFAAELAASALIGLGGVGVAVAENDAAGGEGGLDDLGDGLRAVGEHERHFSDGVDGAQRGFGARVEQDAADAVAEKGASGLAERHYFVACFGERIGKETKLGGLA